MHRQCAVARSLSNVVLTIGALVLALAVASCSGASGDGGATGGSGDTGANDVSRVDAARDGVTPPSDTKPTDALAPPSDATPDGIGPAPDVDPGACETPAAFLCPCETNEDCEDGWCIDSLQGRVCTRTCISECPEGWQCRQNANALPDVIYICIQPLSLVCRPCETDANCRSGLGGSGDRCVDHGSEGRFCGVGCDDETPCPTGYSCTEHDFDGEMVSQCTPDGGVCDCAPAFFGDSTTCYVENDLGRCAGRRSCTDDGLTPCDAPAPAAEECDGVDNDCDGATDEVTDLGTERCGAGACDHTVAACQGGALVECDPFEGAGDESCNGEDDDCDGETDEDWPERGLPCDGPDPGQCANGRYACRGDGSGLVCEDDADASVETCNGLDDDCDGETDDEDELGTVTCGVGVCARSQPGCQGGVPVPCDPLAGASDEQCNGLDDDCDGQTDEAADLGQTTCGLGACRHTVDNCVGGVVRTCEPLEGARGETCNGLDDDCDGTTDEPWPDKYTECDGPDGDVCARGLLVCKDDESGTVCESDEPETLETCNAVDDDCDGQTDEAEDLGETTCGLGVCAHAVSDCVDGEWRDCDPFEGAEDTDDPDPQMLDTNCDGVDGDAARAVFVDHFDGADAGDGTRAHPVATLARAMQLADPVAHPHIFLSVGTYQGPLALRAGVSLFGGYNAAEGWTRDPSNTVTIGGTSRPVTATDIATETILDTLSIVAQANPAIGGSSYGVFLTNSPGVRLRNCFISAGGGGAGEPGSPGAIGTQGATGERGASGCEFLGCVIDVTCSVCSRPTGGVGGQLTCGAADVSGGAGGQGGDPGDQFGETGFGEDGTGFDGLAGRGPSAGAGGPGASADRLDGSPGSPGGAGSSGGIGGGGAAFGSAAAGGYVPADGVIGETGGPGGGGGGGGSGGGDRCIYLPIDEELNLCRTYGSGGGGGGAGGCGGLGGGAGTGGGGSFGIYVVGGAPRIEACTVRTASGGAGGRGGIGGDGGPGGLPGGGGPHGDDDIQGDGASGGAGGAGGRGGAGGGGGGGPSIGIVCTSGGAPAVFDSTIVRGFGGPGGQGPGNPGQVGLSADTHGCP